MQSNPIYSKSPNEFWQDKAIDLAKSIRKNDLKKIQTLIQEFSIDINEPGKDGMTFLLWACLHHHMEATELLLKLGANPNQVIVTGSHVNDSYQIVALLAESNQYNLLKLMLNYGGDPNSLHGYQPALHCAIDSDKDRDSENFENMLLLLDNGADINRVDQSGYTPAMYAASANQYIAVEILLNRGAAIDNTGRLGLTLAHLVELRLEELKEQPNHPYYQQAIHVKQLLIQRGVQFPLPPFTINANTGIRQYAPIIINNKK